MSDCECPPEGHVAGCRNDRVGRLVRSRTEESDVQLCDTDRCPHPERVPLDYCMMALLELQDTLWPGPNREPLAARPEDLPDVLRRVYEILEENGLGPPKT